MRRARTLDALFVLSMCFASWLGAVRVSADTPSGGAGASPGAQPGGPSGSTDLATLEAAFAANPSPRAEAELGLAMLGANRLRDGERHLRAALEQTNDPWIVIHRRSLETAVWAANQQVARLMVRADVQEASVFVDGQFRSSLPITTPLDVTPGEHEVRVEAPGHRTVTQHVRSERGVAADVVFTLPPIVCQDDGMVVADAVAGVCCWPAQTFSSESGRCSGAPRCPTGMEVAGEGCAPLPTVAVPTSDRRARPTGFLLSLQSGFSEFLGSDTGLFRTNASTAQQGIRYRIPLELRFGWRFVRFLSLSVGGGAAKVAFSHWYEDGQGTVQTNDLKPDGIDYWVGAYLDFHTSRARRPGAVDFFFGGGFEPFHKMNLEGTRPDTGGTVSVALRSWTIPVQMGFSFFVLRRMAVDVAGQWRFWLPQEYCGGDPLAVGTGDYCLTGSNLSREQSWSARLGLSWLL